MKGAGKNGDGKTERRNEARGRPFIPLPCFRPSVAVLFLLSACQPQATRLLLLDLALSEPALLNGTAQPWRDEGYRVEYRRFYPHLARADLDRYGTLVVLLGREPEAPSDALNTGDLALLTESVLRGGVVVLGYDADGEGYLDRWTTNRWLDFMGAGISIGDRLLEDTTGRTPSTSGRLQPWAEARAVGDEPLGSVYDPFPLERNNVVAARDTSQVLAVTSGHAFVRAPSRKPAPRDRAGVAAAARVGDGLVIVISRHALGALGPQFRPGTTPVLQLDALSRTRAFLTALARWTRRPAEWAHIPPAAHAAPLVLTQAPVPVELAAPPGAPPRDVDTMSLPVAADPKLSRATNVPDWLRQQGMRVLWAPLLAPRDGRRAVRTSASLDSLISLLDAGGFNLLAGDAGPESMDSVHTRWDERDAVRRAWADAAKRLQPTSVAWIPVLELEHARHAPADSSRGARGEALPMPCALDSTLWADGLASAYGALGRLAADQRTLVIALGLDLGSRGYSMGQEFCDAAWRRGVAGLTRGSQGGERLDTLPYAARYPALRDAGLLPRYYRALEDEVAARAAVLRDRVLKQRRDLYFAFRLAQPPADWFALGLLRGFGLPDRPILLLTPEVRTRELLALYHADGLNLAHAVELAPPSLRARDGTSVKHLVFVESDGFWVSTEEPAAAGPGWRLPPDSLGRLLRRLAR